MLEEIDTLRRALVGAVSHDLRTPLATIKLSASALVESGASLSPDDIKELAELVDAQADRLDRLVSNLLDMTRIQSGALELRRQPAALGDLVDEALLVLGRSGRSAEVGLAGSPTTCLSSTSTTCWCARCWPTCWTMPCGTLRPGATVTVSATSAADGKVEVRVTDSGPGVPPDERERIFQVFNRREAGGRGGLGLAIVQAFLEAHGERIWVEDARRGDGARGASFVFTLPTVPGAR